MTSQPRTVHVPYTLEQDEDGIWCAHAWLGSSGGANGNGATPDEAIADLREAVQMVIDEDGIPEQLARTHEAALGRVIHITERGQRLAAIVPESMLEALWAAEDAEDAAEADAAMDEPGEDVPWEQVKAERGL
jgi:predicted RNase H-like HicB family nuclease